MVLDAHSEPLERRVKVEVRRALYGGGDAVPLLVVEDDVAALVDVLRVEE